MSRLPLQITVDLITGNRIVSVSQPRSTSLNHVHEAVNKDNIDILKSTGSTGNLTKEKHSPGSSGEAGEGTRHSNCICERPKTKVFCKSCSFFLKEARVRVVCWVHPNVFYLSDMDTCPRCKRVGSLQEMRHYDFKLEQKQHPVKLEVANPSKEDDGSPDPSKNFFKRPNASSGNALVTLPSNVGRGDHRYRYNTFVKRH